MMPKYLLLSLLPMLFLLFACTKSPILIPNVKQILVVKAANEAAITASMQLFQLNKKTQKWESQTTEMPVTLGRTGLAWGKGTHPDAWNVGILKKEGDGKAPQGFFPILKLFGYSTQANLTFSPKMPYLQADSNLICVDDVNSKHYNEILDKTKKTEIDWNSHEDMLRKDNLYELGAIIDYNVSHTQIGAGSCVFLHIWRDADKATAGCTAGETNKMKEIFSLLDKKNNPTLIQLTEENYQKAKEMFILP